MHVGLVLGAMYRLVKVWHTDVVTVQHDKAAVTAHTTSMPCCSPDTCMTHMLAMVDRATQVACVLHAGTVPMLYYILSTIHEM